MAVPCKCRAKRILNNRIKFASIPDTFKDLRLSSFRRDYYKDKKSIDIVIAAVKYFLSNIDLMCKEGRGLYFYSETKGSGKTRLATSLANELIYEYDKSVRFATSVDIIAEIRATWGNDAEFSSESKFIDYLTNVEVLVIDDFGTETLKDWLDERFYQILNTRYSKNLITIYTSNIPLERLKYKDKTLSRINERVFEVHFPEESVRDGLAAAWQSKMLKEIGGET